MIIMMNGKEAIVVNLNIYNDIFLQEKHENCIQCSRSTS
jgi:hypothetical protein